jgi:GcrA cell cycle regulator
MMFASPQDVSWSAPRAGGSSWTPEREARAVRLFLLEGFTASEVADALGGGLTRGAVIGKIRRLGYFKRQRVAPGPACGGRAPRLAAACIERRLPPQRPPIPLPPLREVGGVGAPVTLAQLGKRDCRWPIDDPGAGRMHAALFCAGPALRGSPYCAAHGALAAR